MKFRMLRKTVLFLSLLNLFSLAFAQVKLQEDLDFTSDYFCRTWTVAEGLPGNTITDIIQDSNGYIYIGTYDGLVRFDGVDFLTINKNYDLKYDFVSARSLFYDSKQNIWVGSNDEGIFRISPDGVVSKFNIDDGLPNNSIRAITEDLTGNIWVGTADGIAYIDSFDRVFLPTGLSNLGTSNHLLISALFCDSIGRIWIVTGNEKALYIYSNKTFREYAGIRSIEKPQVTCVFQDSDDTFWFGLAPHYVVKLKGGAETLYDISYGVQTSTAIKEIYEDSDKHIWIATDSGLTIIEDEKFSHFDQLKGLADNKVSSILEDREGNIWFGTDRGGIEKLSKIRFKTKKMATTVNALAEDVIRNLVWVGADDGLYCFDPVKKIFIENKITEFCKNVRIRHVEQSKSGNLLISSYDKLGQIIVDEKDNITNYRKEDGLAGSKVRVAIERTNGDLFIGTTTGLSIIDKKTGGLSQVRKSIGIQNEYIMCLYEDSQGRVWCGTDGGGIFIYNNGYIDKKISTSSGLAGNVVFKIQKFGDDIWVSTGTGLSIIRDDKIYNFNSANGLGTDGVFQFLEDSTGKIWGTSNKGIFSVTYSDFNSVIDGSLNKLNAKFYGISEGIDSSGVTSTSLSMKDSSGRIWFTLIDGFTVYDPILANAKLKAPFIQIEGVKVDGIEKDFSKNNIVILPNEKRLTIKYTGLSFISPEHVLFSYKLEGFDKNFSAWTTDRSVSYTNLTPGTYHFSVIAQNADEIMSSISKPLVLIKKPVLWQRPWFIILLILTSGEILFLFINNHFKKMRRDQVRLEKMVSDRTSELRHLQENLQIQVDERTLELRAEKERVQTLYDEVVKSLAGTIDAKDSYTKGHSTRVALYTKMLAEKLGKSEEEQQKFYTIAILHDIGKIGIRNSIINKPGKLTDEEYEIIKTHTVIGAEILSTINSLPEIKVGARWHHERYDGNGYPDKLKASDIPEIARIIGVADAYDAMTSNRSYRKYLDQKTVREEILKNKGTQFDPLIADKMIEIIDEDKDYKLHE